MKKHILGAILLLMPAVSFAAGEAVENAEAAHPPRKPVSDANITGHIQNARTGEHLPYVVIALKGTTIGIAADATGHYFLKNLPTGQFTVSASLMGYSTVEQTVQLTPGKTIEVNFLLDEQSINMDEVVVTSNRNETNRRVAASVVNIANQKLFESTASTNLAASMSFQPGLRVENDCGNCAVTQLRINGLEGQYSQILLDSRPIFSSLAQVYGLDQLPVSMVERVEVTRGGGSALFGSNAIGGVVNIITREPLRNTLTLANTTGIFEDGTPDVNTSFNGAFVSDDHKAGVHIFGMIRDRKHYDRNDDGFSDLPQLNSETAGFRGYYRTSDYTRLTMEYHHMHEERRGGNKFALPPHQTDITESLEHRIDGGGLKFDAFSPSYKDRVSLYASAQYIHRNSYFGTDEDPDGYGLTKDLTYVVGGQYTRQFDKLIFLPAELTAGVEYNYDDLNDKYLGRDSTLLQTVNTIGGYLQSEWKNDHWGVLLGARLDKHNMMSNAVLCPRATVRWSPGRNLGLRASYSSGYRAPQTYNEDLHVAAVSGELSYIVQDPDLKPEYSHSVSASGDWYLSRGAFQANLLAEGFYTSLHDVFTLVKIGDDVAGNTINMRTNASGAYVTGANLEARMGMPGKFDLQMGFTFQKSRYLDPFEWSSELEPQKKMFRSPDTYGYINLTGYVGHDLTLSAFGNYTGKMLVQHVTPGGDKQRMTPEFFDAGFKAAWNFHLSPGVNLELSGGVKNVFDSFQRDLDYGKDKDANYIYGPSNPRMFFFGVKFSL